MWVLLFTRLRRWLAVALPGLRLIIHRLAMRSVQQRPTAVSTARLTRADNMLSRTRLRRPKAAQLTGV
jgi:hypothetical protein